VTRTITARRWLRLRLGRRKAIDLVVIVVLLTAICAGGAVWRVTWIGRRLLHDWVVGAIDQGSGGVYQLRIGQVHFDWTFPPGIAVDSFSLATRRALNARRPQPLPGLRLALYRCTISGVRFFTLVRNAGLIANSFGCESGNLMIQMPRRAHANGPGSPNPAPAGRAFGERQAFLVFQQGVRLPSYAPRIRITQVVFPRIALDVRLPRTANGALRFELGQLQWSMANVVIDPADTTAASRPLFSRTIELAASNFTTHPDRAMTVRVGLLRTSLTDSTLEVRGVAFTPSQSGADFRRSRRHRHDLINLTVGRITAEGIDFGAFMVGQGVRARRIEVDSFRIAVTNDKRLPERSPGSPHRTPQRWIADLDETLSLDSLRVRNGEVVYREHAAGRASSGVITFARIEAAAANVSHFVGRRTSDDPMTLTARAHIQHAGQLDVRFVVPLDASRFDMTFRGTLGAMSALDFNPFVRETDALRISNGQVAGIAFNVAVKHGVASGTITPRFNDLAVSITRHGSGGILGGGGIVGGAARGIATFAANLVVVRGNNPDNPADAPRSGTIHHTFTPDETLIAFIWSTLRGGLLSVVKK
jgi:hypothetical protein